MTGNKRAHLARVAAAILVSGAPVIHLADAKPTSVVPPASEKPRLIVLTDIGNEPDDSMSMVRLLTYANEFDIEGLVATTSTHLRDATHREMIERRVRAYGQVLPNLRVHASGYPDEVQLLSRIRSGSPVYGMSGVGTGKGTEASRLIIEAVDRPDPRPVWVTVWGGGADLAQALWTVRATRSPAEVDRFVSRLRVYSISDQDDAEPWVRANFSKLFWITSVHAFGEYQLATWTGITSPEPGGDQTQVSQPWIDAHIRNRGPLGALYPRIVFGMEGDTPSFLYLIPNGLGSSEHPDWGSWGGRYGQIDQALGLWTDAVDRYPGTNGQPVTGNQATIWRWRAAFQNDFAARMNWSVQPRFSGANHPPRIQLNGVAGQASVDITACAGEVLRLSAKGTSDPDKQNLTYRWWQYREPGARSLSVQFGAADKADTTAIVQPWTHPANLPLSESYAVHVILEVTDDGTPALTRYRRGVIHVLTGGAHDGRQCPTPSLRKPQAFTDDAADRPAAPGTFSTAETSLGDLMDNPNARIILERHVPELTRNPQLGQARSMTLRTLQSYMPALSDEVLNAIDNDLSKMPGRQSGS